MKEFKGTTSMLFIEPTQNNPEEVYITTSPDEFAPAIAAVFENKYSIPPVDKEVRDANALAFAAMPELIKVLQAADKAMRCRREEGGGYGEFVSAMNELETAVLIATAKSGLS